ncbi:hypothetical protein NTD84_01830 [Pseudomonas sp. 14P_8.1_Bac3]|uniref:hypothetical protein n=1 Tax=Pseudomonas sp. 14P_8.1_Bac3 TaxID=2971621 RepID=UPI0021C93CB9|nr:hypothetical protein [Pseudomonas sp. 14P_8.1_Bac3]MCU1758461.1 hypothetical protein [Pseudomonas sp. 14P_8.1_Bac3]
MNDRRTKLDDDICIHIFNSSGAMVGVCLTVVGILRVVINIRQEDVMGQSMLAINAIIYLVTCLIAYWALRTRRAKRNHLLERIADGLFFFGLVFTTLTTGFITFAMSTC